MATTRNYQATVTGTLIASGPGDWGASSGDPAMRYQINQDDQALVVLPHRSRFDVAGRAGGTLVAGEHVWIVGNSIVAVEADNEAPGFET